MIKKIGIIFLVIVLLWSPLFPVMNSMAYTKKQVVELTHAPEFYGTTAIRVPVGTKIDVKTDARFRIFARDLEDGDLTSQIVVTKNTVQTNKVGNYQISYQVTDTNHHTTKITVPVSVVSDITEIWMEKTMYTLPNLEYLEDLGYYRGNHQDRQMIGLYLEPGGSFEMRKTSGQQPLEVKLQNNNAQYESSMKISDTVKSEEDTGWVTIQNTVKKEEERDRYRSVPTVKTLFQEEKVTYEVKYDKKNEQVKVLPYYHQKDGSSRQKEFFKEWDSIPQSYAFLEGQSVVILLTPEDREKLFYKDNVYNKPFTSLEDMFSWWDDVTEQYDRLIGLSSTANKYWNQQIKTKYFVKANENGYEDIYYDYSDYIGIGKSVVWPIFQKSFRTLQVIAQGYQGINNSTDITEVIPEFFAYYIQENTKLFPYSESALGDIDKQEETLQSSRIQNSKNNQEMGKTELLYSIVNLFQNVGNAREIYATTQQYYRETYVTTGRRLSMMDALIVTLSKHYHVDTIPYWQSWNKEISEEVHDEVLLMDTDILYYLKDLVSDDSLATSFKKKYHKEGEYSLVSSQELAHEKLTGTVELSFQISRFSDIQGKYITIQDGSHTIKKVKITGEKLTIQLPVGVYKLALPTPQHAYDYEHSYLIVTNQATTQKKIVYRDIDDISYENDILIRLSGYYGTNYPLQVEIKGKKLQFTYHGTMLKSGAVSGDTIFSKVTVLDLQDHTIYEKSVNGAYQTWVKNTSVKEEVAIELGYKIRLYYAGDPHDFSFISTLTEERLEDYAITNKERTYIVTEYGLVPEEIYQDKETIYQAYRNRLEHYLVTSIDGKQTKELRNPFVSPKKKMTILTSMEKLKEEDKKSYQTIADEIVTGGVPEIRVTKDHYEWDTSVQKSLDYFTKQISIVDEEDGKISTSSDNVTITSNIKWGTVGTYEVSVRAVDSEGNPSTKIIKVDIVEENIDSEEMPHDKKPDEIKSPMSVEPTNSYLQKEDTMAFLGMIGTAILLVLLEFCWGKRKV